MDDAGLDHRFGEHGADRIGEALQAVDDGQQQVLDAAVPKLVHDAQPELGALVLLQPKAEDLLGAIGRHAERDVDRLVSHDALVAHLDAQSVEKHQGIDRLERPGLPGGNLLQDCVGDDADEVG